MMTTTTHAASDHQALRLSRERPASTFNGYVMLLVELALFAAVFVGFGVAADADPIPGILVMILSFSLFLIVACGF
jgi:hypothetical protein